MFILQCCSFGYIPYINLLNQTFIYVQHAPVPVQASLVSPEIFASNIIQLKEGGIALKITKIINSVNAALKFEVFIFLFNVSKNLFPENSILIKLSPIIPIMKGVKKLTLLGRKEIKFNLKKEFKIRKFNKKLPIAHKIKKEYFYKLDNKSKNRFWNVINN